MTAQPRLTVLQSVRCLECERTYSKPMSGGTVWANPGCPHCGYVGWIPAGVSLARRRTRGLAEAPRQRLRVALSR